jgi:DNA-directed RNA polymerase subunit beta
VLVKEMRSLGLNVELKSILDEDGADQTDYSAIAAE